MARVQVGCHNWAALRKSIRAFRRAGGDHASTHPPKRHVTNMLSKHEPTVQVMQRASLTFIPDTPPKIRVPPLQRL